MLPKSCFLVLLLPVVIGLNPGLRLQVNQKAITYLKNVGLEILSQKIDGIKISDLSGKGDGFQYWVSNVHIINFDVPSDQTSVVLKEPNKITITISLAAAATAHYKVRVGTQWFHVDHNGTMAAEAKGSATLTTTLTAVKGKPQVALDGCAVKIKKINITLEGNLLENILNMFLPIVETLFKGKLDEIICEKLTEIVKDDANKELADLATSMVDEKSGFGIDYSLAENPVIEEQIASIGFLAKIFYKGHLNDPKIPVASPTPAVKDSNKMFCINMNAEEVLGSGGYALLVSGKAHLLIDQKFVSQSKLPIGLILSCHCVLVPTCLGKMIPQIGEHCGSGGQVQIEISLGAGPTAHVNSSGAFVSLKGDADLTALLSNGSVIPLFSVSVLASAVVPSDVTFDQWKIKAQVHVTNAKLSLKSSAIGAIDQKGLEQMWQMALVLVVEQELNKMAQKGIPLPAIRHVDVLDPQLYFADHMLTFCFDAKYVARDKQ